MTQDINPLAKAELDRLSKMDFGETEGGGPELPSWMSEKDYPPGTEPFVPPKGEQKQEVQQGGGQPEAQQPSTAEIEAENNRKAQALYDRMNPAQNTVLSEGSKDRFGEARQKVKDTQEVQQTATRGRITGQSNRRI